jgi:hypothetical protein
MRLYEITRITKNSQATRILKRSGWEIAGEGANATVYFREDKPYVLKIFTPYDSAFVAYIKFCQKNSNPHFPKFYKDIVKITKNLCAIRMERLYPLDETEEIITGLEILASYISKYSIDPSFLSHSPEKLENFLKEVVEKRNDVLNYFDESVVAAAELVPDIAKNRGHLDMHPRNFMQRLDGTLVFSDPITTFFGR